MTDLTEAFWLSFVGVISAIVTLSIRMCVRSRCSDVKCLCFSVHRQVDLEAQEAMQSQNPNNATMDEIYRTESKEQNIRL